MAGKKLTLDTDALRVETFESVDERNEEGTVLGNAITMYRCPTAPTEACDTCPKTCEC
ncbi:MAG TPA: hypothetical protein VFJ82_03370 [Longimicrobium sp.]|nr:hypothetical protein [Longimicrobium sp.]